jgi:hypothetical protein
MSARDPVRLRPKRIYAEIDMDVYPRRLTERGINRMADLLRAALQENTAKRVSCSHGRSGCHVNRIDKEIARGLADELRRVASDPDCIEEVHLR